MALPTTVKEIFAHDSVSKVYDQAEAMIKDKPLTMLAVGAAAGAAIGFLLPASRLLRMGILLYPIYQSYKEEQSKKKMNLNEELH